MTQKNITMHKKRFGQFFSGKTVSDMLFSLLPKQYKWTTVIDPMAGIGDMLISVRDNSKECPVLLGVEIDDGVVKECTNRLPEATILCGDAFKCDEIVTLQGFDLVITNPPYVRYQLQNEDDEVMPSAKEIRDNLTRQIKKLPYLSDNERDLFLCLTKNYSGLADMAVPAWLLCAALVRKDGYLAIVVPETWLNRNYAAPIQYLLQKCFRIETIAKDPNASWFPEALVKTCLVVAKRIEMQNLSQSKQNITRIIENKHEYFQSTASLFPSFCDEAMKWCTEEDKPFFTDKLDLPNELSKILGNQELLKYDSLSSLGIECGQGLRTGANDFFYVRIEREEGEMFVVRSNAWDQGGKEYYFKKDDIVPTLQSRGEIEGLVVSRDRLVTGVVYPRGEVHGDLKEYIASAANYQDAKGRQFKDFSAVKPNEKKKGSIIIREWYRLPKMMNRHLPDLCLTRVSTKTPECLYVNQSAEAPIAIDANMVALWGKTSNMVRVVMAALNSTWSKLSLELICTVMGGGALKVEASHIRKLLLPKFSNEQLEALERVGEDLIVEGHMTVILQDRIDDIVAQSFINKTVTHQMRELLKRKYKERSTRL